MAAGEGYLPPVVAQILADASDLVAKLEMSKKMLEEFDGKVYTVHLKLDTDATTKAEAEHTELEAIFAAPLTQRVNLDTSGMAAQAIAARATVSALMGGSGAGGGAISGIGGGAAGGGGGAGLDSAALGFTGAGLMPPLVPPHANWGTWGSMAGFGAEHIIGTGIGLAGSAGGAAIGGGALALGSLGTTAVGAGSDAAVMKSTLADTQLLSKTYQQLQMDQLLYGKNSKQAAADTQLLNAQMEMLGNTAGVQAEMGLVKSTNALNTLWDNATSGARVAAVSIMQQVVDLGTTYTPLVANAAQKNLTIINEHLKPLFTWLKGPEGIGIFNDLETAFRTRLPFAVDAFTQGVELLFKTIDHVVKSAKGVESTAMYFDRAGMSTKSFSEHLDSVLTRLNGSGWDDFTKKIDHTIYLFETWKIFLKVLGEDVKGFFHESAQAGTGIIQTLTDILLRLHDWETSLAGENKMKTFFAAGKDEVIALIKLIPALIAPLAQIEMTIGPPMREMITLAARFLDFLTHIPGVGPIIEWGAAILVLNSRMHLLSILMGAGGLIANIVKFGAAFVVVASEVGIGQAALALFGKGSMAASEDFVASQAATVESVTTSSAVISTSMETAAATIVAAIGEITATLEGLVMAFATSSSTIGETTTVMSSTIREVGVISTVASEEVAASAGLMAESMSMAAGAIDLDAVQIVASYRSIGAASMLAGGESAAGGLEQTAAKFAGIGSAAAVAAPEVVAGGEAMAGAGLAAGGAGLAMGTLATGGLLAVGVGAIILALNWDKVTTAIGNFLDPAAAANEALQKYNDTAQASVNIDIAAHQDDLIAAMQRTGAAADSNMADVTNTIGGIEQKAYDAQNNLFGNFANRFKSDSQSSQDALDSINNALKTNMGITGDQVKTLEGATTAYNNMGSQGQAAMNELAKSKDWADLAGFMNQMVANGGNVDAAFQQLGATGNTVFQGLAAKSLTADQQMTANMIASAQQQGQQLAGVTQQIYGLGQSIMAKFGKPAYDAWMAQTGPQQEVMSNLSKIALANGMQVSDLQKVDNQQGLTYKGIYGNLSDIMGELKAEGPLNDAINKLMTPQERLAYETANHLSNSSENSSVLKDMLNYAQTHAGELNTHAGDALTSLDKMSSITLNIQGQLNQSATDMLSIRNNANSFTLPNTSGASIGTGTPRSAEGNIFNSPTLTWIGENHEKEWVVPQHKAMGLGWLLDRMVTGGGAPKLPTQMVGGSFSVNSESPSSTPISINAPISVTVQGTPNSHTSYQVGQAVATEVKNQLTKVLRQLNSGAYSVQPS